MFDFNTNFQTMKGTATIMKKITSPLGFGLMRLPTLENGKIDYEHGQKMVDYALENGVNYFDTADPYHGGESENFIGTALAKHDRESYFLTTKMPVWKVDKKEDAISIFENQLKKCQTEYFDYYLVHAVDIKKFNKAVNDGVVEYLKEQKAQGKITNLGFSFHAPATELEEIISYTDWDFVQLQINYYDVLDQDAQMLIDVANKYNVPIIVMEPIRGGFLAKNVPNGLELIKNAYSDKYSASALALSYCFDTKGVFLSLSGMSNFEQIEENIKTAKNPIPNDAKREKLIQDVMNEIKNFVSITCTKCEYCLPCPAGINIPGVFTTYNDYKLFQNKMRTKGEIEAFDAPPSACIECGQCEGHCPQQLQIIELLKSVDKEFSVL